jgi:hypothetical protein
MLISVMAWKMLVLVHRSLQVVVGAFNAAVPFGLLAFRKVSDQHPLAILLVLVFCQEGTPSKGTKMLDDDSGPAIRILVPDNFSIDPAMRTWAYAGLNLVRSKDAPKSETHSCQQGREDHSTKVKLNQCLAP